MKIEVPTNTFLKPMFGELDEAWNIGFNVKSILTNKVKVFRITLIYVVLLIQHVERFLVFQVSDLISPTRNNLLNNGVLNR